MNKFLYRAAAGAGLLAIAWVGVDYLRSNPLALAMTLLIAAFYAMGVLELRRFQQATTALLGALSALSGGQPSSLADWLAQVPAALRNTVRLRAEGERVALPGPALTPYLAGLLVLLGMLGTFLGMVVTLNGTGLALEQATNVQTMRDSLAAPVKGLGLAFGTSVAGVAASAMLGLLAALCRRERQQAVQLLDHHIATSLRAFTRAHQRELQGEAAFALQQRQAEQQAALHAVFMPLLTDKLQALMAQLEQQAQASNAQLLASQDRFHGQAEAAYRALAASVDQTLQRSLTDSAHVAAATLLPAVESTMAGITRETAALHGHIAHAVVQQLDGFAQGFETRSALWVEQVGRQAQAQSTALVQTLAQAQADQQAQHSELVARLRDKLSHSLQHDNTLLEERSRTLAALNTLLGAVQHTSTAQQAAIDGLVAATAHGLEQAAARFTEKVDAESARLEQVTAQLTGSAVEVASLGEALGAAVGLFSQSSQQLVTQLQKMEDALGKNTTRSDEQLAYYVAQAREVIDLSLLSQKQIVDELQRLAARQAAEV